MAAGHGFGACRFVGGYGNKNVHPEIAAVVELHDSFSFISSFDLVAIAVPNKEMSNAKLLP